MTKENEKVTENTEKTDTTGTNTTVADKLYDKTDVTTDGKENTTDDDNKNNNDQKSTDDSSKTTDEGKKTDGDKKPEDKKAAEESKVGDDTKKVYEDVVLPKDLPEGIQIDNDLFDEVKEIAAEGNIPKETLQKLVNAYSKRITDSDNAMKDQWLEVEKGWIESAKNDKEIGGEHFEANIVKANKAVEMFGTPELKELFDLTRIGNHPELIRFCVKIGEKISEGGAFVRGDNTPQKKSNADVMYDKTDKT